LTLMEGSFGSRMASLASIADCTMVGRKSSQISLSSRRIALGSAFSKAISKAFATDFSMMAARLDSEKPVVVVDGLGGESMAQARPDDEMRRGCWGGCDPMPQKLNHCWL